MPRHRNIDESELLVLRVLWAPNTHSIRDVIKSLKTQGIAWARTTVQTHLTRLEAKGLVKCDRSRREHEYRAACSREEIGAQGLHRLADELCEGSMTQQSLWLMTNLPFSHDDIARFCTLLERFNRSTPEPLSASDGSTKTYI
ncbi:MAG: BlaI/MecI/CopY family transcriptional regulator [Candidatus Hydrogenedentes bacterium]|nr:BlaI/MecI/CopY family transcriptional regulator [Candidatus Hydrogenedentota bacterium]